MKPPVPARKPDATDGEHLRQVVESTGYAFLAARYAKMIADEGNKLLHAKTEREMALAQGAMFALQAVVDAPKRIADEIAAREAKK